MEITVKKYIVLTANINHPETLRTMHAQVTSKGCELVIDNGIYNAENIQNIITFLETCLTKM